MKWFMLTLVPVLLTGLIFFVRLTTLPEELVRMPVEMTKKTPSETLPVPVDLEVPVRDPQIQQQESDIDNMLLNKNITICIL